MDKRLPPSQRPELKKVIKSNELIRQGRYNLTVTQQKFVCYIATLIKPNEPSDKEFIISVKDFCELIGIDPNGFYSEFKSLIEDFDNQSFWIDNGHDLIRYRWFNDEVYHYKKGFVSLTPSKRFREYIIGLKKNYTEYELFNILALQSKYGLRLYELLRSYEYKGQIRFNLIDFKIILGANTKAYEDVRNFKKRVLQPAIDEIESYTDLHIEYELERRGRAYASILFKISKKGTPDNFIAYRNTLDKINKQNNQVKGQISIFDLSEDDFKNEQE